MEMFCHRRRIYFGYGNKIIFLLYVLVVTCNKREMVIVVKHFSLLQCDLYVTGHTEKKPGDLSKKKNLTRCLICIKISQTRLSLPFIEILKFNKHFLNDNIFKQFVITFYLVINLQYINSDKKVTRPIIVPSKKNKVLLDK